MPNVKPFFKLTHSKKGRPSNERGRKKGKRAHRKGHSKSRINKPLVGVVNIHGGKQAVQNRST